MNIFWKREEKLPTTGKLFILIDHFNEIITNLGG